MGTKERMARQHWGDFALCLLFVLVTTSAVTQTEVEELSSLGAAHDAGVMPLSTDGGLGESMAKEVEECIKKLKLNKAASPSSKCTKVLRDAAKGLVKQNVDLAKQEAALLSKAKKAVKKSVTVVKAAHQMKGSLAKMSAPTRSPVKKAGPKPAKKASKKATKKNAKAKRMASPKTAIKAKKSKTMKQKGKKKAKKLKKKAKEMKKAAKMAKEFIKAAQVTRKAERASLRRKGQKIPAALKKGASKNAAKRVNKAKKKARKLKKKSKDAKLGPKPHYPKVKPGTVAAKQVEKLKYERKHPKEASAARAKLRKS